MLVRPGQALVVVLWPPTNQLPRRRLIASLNRLVQVKHRFCSPRGSARSSCVASGACIAVSIMSVLATLVTQVTNELEDAVRFMHDHYGQSSACA